MSIFLVCLGIMVLFVTPSAAEFSVWRAESAGSNPFQRGFEIGVPSDWQ